MKAMIFAAGLGTRLRPLTNDRPKALVEVAGKTLLQRAIDSLVAAGCTTIVVNVHHFAHKVIAAISDINPPDVDILVSDESDLLLDTGGGVLAARPLLKGDEPILIHNVDIITRDLDLKAIVTSHVTNHALATLLVKQRDTRRYFLFDDNMSLRGWENTATGAFKPDDMNASSAIMLHHRAFGGIHVISPAIFDYLQDYAHIHGPVFSITDFYIDNCRRCNIRAYQQITPYQWLDVGKPDTLNQAINLLKENN